MGKYSNISKLSSAERERLFIRFARLLASVKSTTEAAHVMRDLLTEPEVLMIARRLQVIELLESHWSYAEIERAIKVSSATIAKLQTWIGIHGEEFKKISSRTSAKPKDEGYTKLSYRQMKKKLPMYHWPEILLESIVDSANKRQREQLVQLMNQMKEKTELTRNLDKILERSRAK